MADVKLEPGWLIRDVRKASERLKKWTEAQTNYERSETELRNPKTASVGSRADARNTRRTDRNT